jgi:hypothetical protein
VGGARLCPDAPRTGRLQSRDPDCGDPAAPLRLHKYVYADDDPVNKTDPSGLYAQRLPDLVVVTGVLGALAVSSFSRPLNIPIQLELPCPPCRLADGTLVSVGTTIAYREVRPPPPGQTKHGGFAVAHLELSVAHQSPWVAPRPCKCFWVHLDYVDYPHPPRLDTHPAPVSMTDGIAPQLLGYDVRLDQSVYTRQHWTPESRATFLMQQDVRWPLSVDLYVWPSYFLRALPPALRGLGPRDIPPYVAERAIEVNRDEGRWLGLHLWARSASE